MAGLDSLCDHLAAKARNESLEALWNSTTQPTTLRGIVIYQELQTESPYNESLVNATEGPETWYEAILEEIVSVTHTRFRELNEWYAIPTVAVLGIVGNIWAIAALATFVTMWRNAVKLHMVILVVDTFLLVMTLTFTQLRQQGIAGPHRKETMQYITMALSFFQFLSIWVLYVAATDAYRHYNSFRKSTSLKKLKNTPRNLLLTFLAAILLHIPFLPILRIKVWEKPSTRHDPCTNPVENHWNFAIQDAFDQITDLHYVLYFTLVYYLFWYALSVFLLACRDKDIIDCLQTMVERQKLYHNVTLPAVQAGHTAMLVSALCNISLFCLVLKLTLLTFKLFEFAVDFLSNSRSFFLFVNEIANLCQVVRAAVYLPVMMHYSPHCRQFTRNIFCVLCDRYRSRHTKGAKQEQGAEQDDVSVEVLPDTDLDVPIIKLDDM